MTKLPLHAPESSSPPIQGRMPAFAWKAKRSGRTLLSGAVLPAQPSPSHPSQQQLCKSICDYFPDLSSSQSHLLARALKDARQHHQGQLRKSGEAYVMHPLRVARMTAEAGMGLQLVIIALLHDVIEDTEMTKQQMHEAYGSWIADAVDGLSKVQAARPQNRAAAVSLETYRKLIVSTLRDLRVLQVKIYDRLDNLRDLAYLPRANQRRISNETMGVYVPMAQRLGMQEVAEEMALLCFRFRYPQRFRRAQQAWENGLDRNAEKMARLETQLREYLEEPPDPVHAEIYPIYPPLSAWTHQRSLPNEGIEGFRIAVPGRMDCYRALGKLHARCRVVPNSIRDYISNPKPNRYQALHSQVFSAGEPLSVRIVSHVMDRINAVGALSGNVADDNVADNELHRYYQQYLELLDQYKGAEDLRMEDVLRYAQMDTLQLFTTTGRTFAFPTGSTVLDFAFAFSLEAGLHCCGARMGEREVSPAEALRDGEVITVHTDAKVCPKADWLAHVHTTKARGTIRRFLREDLHLRANRVGERILQAQIDGRGTLREILESNPRYERALRLENLSREQFPFLLGIQKIDLFQFLQKHKLLRTNGLKRTTTSLDCLGMKRTPKLTLCLEDLGVGWLRLAPCCAPLPGDVVRVVQRRYRMEAHREHCTFLARRRTAGSRFFRATWCFQASDPPLRMRICMCQRRAGQVYVVSKVMRDLGVSILDIQLASPPSSEQAEILVRLERISLNVFRHVSARLRAHHAVAQIHLLAEPFAQSFPPQASQP